jgi:hypothetical protein
MDESDPRRVRGNIFAAVVSSAYITVAILMMHRCRNAQSKGERDVFTHTLLALNMIAVGVIDSEIIGATLRICIVMPHKLRNNLRQDPVLDSCY